MLIYKILLPSEWDACETAESFGGSPFDRESGFIHFSSREQVAHTARLVFPHEPELVIAAVDADAVGDTLRWETASDGGRFPHLYGTLPRAAVVAVYRVAGAADVDAAIPTE